MALIQIRKVNFAFPQQTERYWCGNSAFKTHLFNSFTLGVPDIEKYLILNIKKRINKIDNPTLKQEAQAFMTQEGQHSLQHSKFWDNLRYQGYTFDTYQALLQSTFFQILERRLSENFNLAISAGLEHLTTLMATAALEDNWFAEAEPQLRQLFEWHALEEIEHKTVVYDVLQNATRNYLLRLMGMLIANFLILVFLNLGLFMFLYQDKKLLDQKVWQEMLEFWMTKDKFLYRVLINSIEYFRKDFHPSKTFQSHPNTTR
jgi:uncharacterized protein